MSKIKSKKSNVSNKNQTIYGLHSVRAALLNDKRVHFELILHENNRNFVREFNLKATKITILNKKEFEKLYRSEQSNQGIILKTKEFERPSLSDFLKNEDNQSKSIILALDQLTDPQNIGSIMRSCALFNCKGIIISKDNAPELTPSLFKAASGAAEVVNYFRVTNLKRTISNLKKHNYWVYGFDSSNNGNSKLSFAKKSVLVFGSEGKGMRELIKKECDEIIKLEMKVNLKYQIESLNVSNATAIALHEFYKI